MNNTQGAITERKQALQDLRDQYELAHSRAADFESSSEFRKAPPGIAAKIAAQGVLEAIIADLSALIGEAGE